MSSVNFESILSDFYGNNFGFSELVSKTNGNEETIIQTKLNNLNPLFAELRDLLISEVHQVLGEKVIKIFWMIYLKLYCFGFFENILPLFNTILHQYLAESFRHFQSNFLLKLPINSFCITDNLYLCTKVQVLV